MDRHQIYKAFSEQDPEAFRQGFMDFSDKIVELHNQAFKNGYATDPYTAGYEYAIGLALQPITATLIETVRQHISETEKQTQLRDYLEEIFKI